MARRNGQMTLTADHVASVHRVLTDTGPEPHRDYMTDADYEAMVHSVLADHPRGTDLWLFACGSLIWKPEVNYQEERPGIVKGWHRAFCLRIERWRGTPELPGLMMALDRGGQCQGVAYRLTDRALAEDLNKLMRREMSAIPPGNMPRWVTVHAGRETMRALAFVSNRASHEYAGRLSHDTVADVLAQACGHVGSGAEYLYNTVAHLEERGIRDRNLWRLQHMVGERIAARCRSTD